MDKLRAIPRHPRTARAMAATRARRLTLAAIATSLALAAARPAHAGQDQEMVIRTLGAVTYVCGGIAEDERAKLAAKEKDYNLGVLFTGGPSGEYLADVDVRLTRDGQEVATFRADGPRCLIRAPEGSYNIDATYKGQAKSIKVTTGNRNAQLRW